MAKQDRKQKIAAGNVLFLNVSFHDSLEIVTRRKKRGMVPIHHSPFCQAEVRQARYSARILDMFLSIWLHHLSVREDNIHLPTSVCRG